MRRRDYLKGRSHDDGTDNVYEFFSFLFFLSLIFYNVKSSEIIAVKS